jgi:hypothetical protein
LKLNKKLITEAITAPNKSNDTSIVAASENSSKAIQVDA